MIDAIIITAIVCSTVLSTSVVAFYFGSGGHVSSLRHKEEMARLEMQRERDQLKALSE